MTIAAPEPIAEYHQIESFSCGEDSLDQWLKKRALANQVHGASRTFVVADRMRVVAYYALASGSVSANVAPGSFRRNMPDPVPVVLLGRLAVDSQYAGQGIARGMFKDALQRVTAAAGAIGIRGIATHPLSDAAREFYRRLGFMDCPGDNRLMVVSLKDAIAALT